MNETGRHDRPALTFCGQTAFGDPVCLGNGGPIREANQDNNRAT